MHSMTLNEEVIYLIYLFGLIAIPCLYIAFFLPLVILGQYFFTSFLSVFYHFYLGREFSHTYFC